MELNETQHFFACLTSSLASLIVINTFTQVNKYACWFINTVVVYGLLVLSYFLADEDPDSKIPWSWELITNYAITAIYLTAIPCTRFLATPTWSKQLFWKGTLAVHIGYWIVVHYFQEQYLIVAGGLLLFIGTPSRRSISINNEKRALKWLDLDWTFVLCYTFWHIAHLYSVEFHNYDKAQLLGLSLGVDIVSLLWGPQNWIMTRFQTQGLFKLVWLALRDSTSLWPSTSSWHTEPSELWLHISTIGLGVLLIAYTLSKDKFIEGLEYNYSGRRPLGSNKIARPDPADGGPGTPQGDPDQGHAYQPGDERKNGGEFGVPPPGENPNNGHGLNWEGENGSILDAPPEDQAARRTVPTEPGRQDALGLPDTHRSYNDVLL